MDLKRQPNERETDYQRRIVTGKLIDKSLADEDYGDLSELVYGERHHSDHCRKLFTGVRKYIEAEERDLAAGFAKLDTLDDPEILDKIEQANILLKKERIRTQEQRAAYLKLIREQAKHETTKDIIESTMKQMEFPKLNLERVEHETKDTVMLISLSDLHIGATIDNHWNKYNTEIAGERLEQYFDKIVEVNKKEKCRTATVYANGDIVSGIIHPNLVISSKENLIQQITIASELISQFLVALSGEFEHIDFCSVPGNHSRLSTKLDSPLYERADDLIEFYLQARLKDVENISFDAGNKIDPTICVLTLSGKNFAVVHGDMDSDNKVEALQRFCGVELYGVLTAHMHHLRIQDVRGIKVLQSGSLMGCDDFTVEKRIYGCPSQLLTIFGDGVECVYNVEFK